MSGFMDFLIGRSPQFQQMSRLTGGQEDLLNNLMMGLQGQGSMAGLFGVDPEFFQQSFVDPAMRQFEQRTAPAIQQRFIASGGARGSNVQDSLTRAGADMQGQLNQTLAGLINQAQNRAMQGAQLGLGTQAFGFQEIPGQEGFLQQMAGGLAGGLTGGFAQPFGQGMANMALDWMRPKGQTQRQGYSG
jgi:hypothetical protein